MNEHVALKPPVSDAYRDDFYAWAKAQASLLRQRELQHCDVDNLAEEIEELARSDEREVVSRLKRIVEHLLKLSFSADANPREKWRSSVAHQRDNLDMVLARSPSLNARRGDLFDEAWSRGMKLAQFELRHETKALTQLKLAQGSPVFTVDDALDPDFFPGD